MLICSLRTKFVWYYHVSLFIGLHLQALSDNGCPVCKHGKHLYVHSEESLFCIYHEGRVFFRLCNFVFVRCRFYTSIDVYLLKELVSSVWELLSP